MVAKFDLVIPGLKCKRKLANNLHHYPDNALVLNQTFTEQSLTFCIEFNPQGSSYGPEATKNTVYEFKIERLPSSIRPEKSQIKVGPVEKLEVRLFDQFIFHSPFLVYRRKNNTQID